MPQEAPRPATILVETPRAAVHYEEGLFSGDEMKAFAQLVDQGIRDIESYLHLDAASEPDRKIHYYVTRRVRISMTRGRRIFLPAARVRSRSAPYLHETTHVLFPSRSDAPWLTEGFASYIEGCVSESLGGYDGHVFSQGGNRGIDGEAGRFLVTEEGRAVLPYVGTAASPPRLFEDRQHVAAPFYVLSQSFLKFLVTRLGIERVVTFVQAVDSADALRTATSRTPDAWKTDWLAALRSGNREFEDRRAPTPPRR